MAYTRTFYFNYRSTADLPYRLEFYDQGFTAANYADIEGELGQMFMLEDEAEFVDTIKAFVKSVK